ncbi:VanZ family protein [Thermoanaerobacterium thermosaccharolyticum]|uniref:VanZ family protein n=1 Tax=Thermoanaerobacterium thermosaccharolyticum TaxID=1517 RepID=UPI003DAA2F6C
MGINFPIGLKAILFIFFIPLIIKQFKSTKNIVIVTFMAGFIIYAIELISIVFFPITFYPPMPNYTPNVNIVPMKDIIILMRLQPINIVIKNVVGNIILFIPLGFFVPIIYRKMNKFNYTLLLGLCVSVFIEIAQFIIDYLTKYPNHTCDVNDVILNIIGLILGFIIQRGIRKVSFMANYINNVANKIE